MYTQGAIPDNFTYLTMNKKIIDSTRPFLLILIFCSMLNGSCAYNWASGSNGDVMWASGCDFYGNDISNVASSGADCGCYCASNPNCDHFTWYNNVCYLKKAINPPATDLSGAVCGWVTARTYCPGIQNQSISISSTTFAHF